MTVSRVVNGGKNVRDATRLRVTQAVEQLKYSPNTAARSLAAGQPMHVGLLYANPSAGYLSQFLVGALHAARHAGAQITIEACESEDPGDQAEAARRFAQGDVDGVLLPPPLSESRPILAELASIRMPFVTVAMPDPKPQSLNVRIDDRAAAEEMTRYLIGLGHRQIGFIKGHPHHVASGDRFKGFADAVKEAGLNVADMPVEQGYFSYRSGLIAAERLLDRTKRPTAIFASNDDMGAAAISVAHRRGLIVPDDVSVVGFDDTLLATSVWPELTTVKQPISAMAEAALELLIADLRSRQAKTPRRVHERVLAHALIIRESTAAPPGGKAKTRRKSKIAQP
jgi:LacI family transcriptional regulator